MNVGYDNILTFTLQVVKFGEIISAFAIISTASAAALLTGSGRKLSRGWPTRKTRRLLSMYMYIIRKQRQTGVLKLRKGKKKSLVNAHY